MNVKLLEETSISFRVSTSHMGSNYQVLITHSLEKYMEGWSDHKDGLWRETVKTGERIGI